MTWAKLHEGFWLDPKILALDDAAFRTWVQALAWSTANLSDGVVPVDGPFFARKTARRRAELAASLLATGLWERTEDGPYLIVNFAKYQPTKQQVEQRRQADSDRQRRWRSRRDRRGDASEGHAVSPAPRPVVPKGTRGDARAPHARAGVPHADDDRDAAMKTSIALGKNWAGAKDVDDAVLENALRDVPNATDDTVAAGFEARDRTLAERRQRGVFA